MTVLHELAPNPFFMQHVLGLTPNSYSGLLLILFLRRMLLYLGVKKLTHFRGLKSNIFGGLELLKTV